MTAADGVAALLFYMRRVSAQPPAPLPTRPPVPAAAAAPRAMPAAPPAVKPLAELQAMQRDPRYARPDKREAGFVQQVDAEWRRAFPGTLPASHVGGALR